MRDLVILATFLLAFQIPRTEAKVVDIMSIKCGLYLMRGQVKKENDKYFFHYLPAQKENTYKKSSIFELVVDQDRDKVTLATLGNLFVALNVEFKKDSKEKRIMHLHSIEGASTQTDTYSVEKSIELYREDKCQ